MQFKTRAQMLRTKPQNGTVAAVEDIGSGVFSEYVFRENSPSLTPSGDDVLASTVRGREALDRWVRETGQGAGGGGGGGSAFPYPVFIHTDNKTLTSADQGLNIMNAASKAFTLPSTAEDGETYMLGSFGYVVTVNFPSALITNQTGNTMQIDRIQTFQAFNIVGLGLVWGVRQETNLGGHQFALTWNAGIRYERGMVAVVDSQMFMSRKHGNINHAVSDRSWWAPLALPESDYYLLSGVEDEPGVVDQDQLAAIMSTVKGLKRFLCETFSIAFADTAPVMQFSNCEFHAQRNYARLQLQAAPLGGLPRLLNGVQLVLPTDTTYESSGSADQPETVVMDGNARIEATSNTPLIQISTGAVLRFIMKGSSHFSSPEGGYMFNVAGGTLIFDVYSDYDGECLPGDLIDGSSGTVIINDYRPRLATHQGRALNSAQAFSATLQYNDRRTARAEGFASFDGFATGNIRSGAFAIVSGVCTFTIGLGHGHLVGHRRYFEFGETDPRNGVHTITAVTATTVSFDMPTANDSGTLDSWVSDCNVNGNIHSIVHNAANPGSDDGRFWINFKEARGWNFVVTGNHKAIGDSVPYLGLPEASSFETSVACCWFYNDDYFAESGGEAQGVVKVEWAEGLTSIG